MRHRIQVIAAALAILTPGCSATMFQRDPMVEVVRSITTANVDIVRAMTEALSRAQSSACAVPEVK